MDKKIKIGIGIIVLVLIGWFFVGQNNNSKIDKPVSIGAILPMTGVGSGNAQNIREGIDLAVKEINESGGIHDNKILLSYEDDKTDPKEAVTAFSKLVTIDNVDIVIGGIWTNLANPIVTLSKEKNVFTLSPSAIPDGLSVESPYFYTLYPAISSKLKLFESYLSDNRIQNIGILVVNNEWGLKHAEVFENAINNVGVNLVEKRIVQSIDNNDIATELSIFKNKNVDTLLVALNYGDMASLGKKKIETGYNVKILAHSNFEDALIYQMMPQGAKKGVHVFKFNQPNNEFVNKFSSEYDKNPKIYTDVGYDSVYVLKRAIEEEGSLNPDSLAKSMEHIKFNGASGQISFEDRNYPLNKKPVLKNLESGEEQIFE